MAAAGTVDSFGRPSSPAGRLCSDPAGLCRNVADPLPSRPQPRPLHSLRRSLHDTALLERSAGNVLRRDPPRFYQQPRFLRSSPRPRRARTDPPLTRAPKDRGKRSDTPASTPATPLTVSSGEAEAVSARPVAAVCRQQHPEPQSRPTKFQERVSHPTSIRPASNEHGCRFFSQKQSMTHTVTR